jgi:phosphate transport system protein
VAGRTRPAEPHQTVRIPDALPRGTWVGARDAAVWHGMPVDAPVEAVTTSSSSGPMNETGGAGGAGERRGARGDRDGGAVLGTRPSVHPGARLVEGPTGSGSTTGWRSGRRTAARIGSADRRRACAIQRSGGVSYLASRVRARAADASLPRAGSEADVSQTVREKRRDLQLLAGEIAEMGGLAERLVMESVTALSRIDAARARRVIADDARLDQMQRRIEDHAIALIAAHRPTDKPLRELVAALRISSDLERVGDLAKNNAKRVLAIEGRAQPQRVALGVEHMSEIALEQLKAVLDAFTTQDLPAALDVRNRDDEVDAIYTSIFRELLTYMAEDPRNITFCTHLLFCAKNIERIGDHATNIAENIHYLVTGEQLTEARAKADHSAYLPADFSDGFGGDD